MEQQLRSGKKEDDSADGLVRRDWTAHQFGGWLKKPSGILHPDCNYYITTIKQFLIVLLINNPTILKRVLHSKWGGFMNQHSTFNSRIRT